MDKPKIELAKSTPEYVKSVVDAMEAGQPIQLQVGRGSAKSSFGIMLAEEILNRIKDKSSDRH